MARFRRRLGQLVVCMLMLSLISVAQSKQAVTTAAPGATKAKAIAKRKQKPAPAPEPAPAPPLPPPTPEQMPAVQPRVLFQNGLLSIDAPNSTMTDVLNAVHRQTGAKIDVPAGAGGDRIVARLGPGQPRDVLASLLSGSKFDYIILGPPQNPAGVQRVILSRRQAGAAAAPSENAGQPTFQPQVIPPPEDAESGDEVEPELPEEAPPQPETAAPTLQPGQDPNQQQQGQQGQGQGQNSNQPKSPEQLLQELQRMQQQQQQPDPNQQPQQQPSPDRNPPDEQ